MLFFYIYVNLVSLPVKFYNFLQAIFFSGYFVYYIVIVSGLVFLLYFLTSYYQYIRKLFNLFIYFASRHFTKLIRSKIFYVESFRFSMQIFLTAFTGISIALLNDYSDGAQLSFS